MAQPAAGLYSTFGFQCCLLFLLASWQAGGATALQEPQKTAASPKSNHSLPRTPGRVYSPPPDHSHLHSGQRPPDFPTAAETQKPKRQCNTTHRAKTVHKPTDASKNPDQERSRGHQNTPPTSEQNPIATETQKAKRQCNTTHSAKTVHKPTDASKNPDHERSRARQNAPPTSEQNSDSREKDLVARSGRAADMADAPGTGKGSSDGVQTTSVPKTKTTCRSSTRNTRVTQNLATTPRPTESKTSAPPHNPGSPESSRITARATPEKSDGAADHGTTGASERPLISPTKYRKETMSAHEGATGTHVTPVDDAAGATSAHEEATGAHVTPADHGAGTMSAHKGATGAHVTPVDHGAGTMSAHEKVTGGHVTPADHAAGTMSNHEEATGGHVTPVDHGAGATSAYEKVTGAHVTPADHGAGTMSAHEEATGGHETPTDHGAGTMSAHEEVTGGHVTPTDHAAGATSAHEGATGAHVTPVDHGAGATSAHEGATGAHVTPVDHGAGTMSAHEEVTGGHVTPADHGAGATSAHEEMTQVSTQPIGHPEEKITSISENPIPMTAETIKVLTKSTESPGKPATVTQTLRPAAQVTGDESTAPPSSYFNATQAAHQGPVGSPTRTTSGKNPSATLTDAPDKSSPHQTQSAAQAGLHTAEPAGGGSFPAWAIVIVVLVAVILLLLFIGLIVMVFCMSRARHALAEDNDPEDKGGRNSYPVYLMEQQNLGRSRIPAPQ